jgi:Fic family protein
MAQEVYIPAFNRYPPAILQAFGRIERARGIIESATILPAQEEILRRDALVGSIHYSNVIEGNELSRLEALRAVKHELPPDDRAKLELVNYVAAIDFLRDRQGSGGIRYSAWFLKHLHSILTKGLGREDARFKPRHEGEWRDGAVTVGDQLHLYHVAPDPDRVDALMTARLDWLERKREDPAYPAPILAGLAHFEVTEVHPFADYNGRVARLFALSVFYRENFVDRPLFSPERYYAEDKDAYYAALRAIKLTHHLDEWLTYFAAGLAEEFERVAAKVQNLNALTRELELPLELSPGQEKAIAALTVEGRRDLTIPEYTRLAGVSSRTASRELNALVIAGVLRARGTTRDRRFVIAQSGASVGGRPRVWSDERIRRELGALVEQVGGWPSYTDFQRAKLLPLYAAMARTGGADRWRVEIGGPAVAPA